jgi:hypothetical protein
VPWNLAAAGNFSNNQKFFASFFQKRRGFLTSLTSFYARASYAFGGHHRKGCQHNAQIGLSLNNGPIVQGPYNTSFA